MDLKCYLEYANSLTNVFTFDWIINRLTTGTTTERVPLTSTLNGGTNFQIVLQLSDTRYCDAYGYTMESMRVGLLLTDAKKCAIKAYLLFEIQNYSRELYFKDIVEKRFSFLNEEHLSDSFEMPISVCQVRGRYKNIEFNPKQFRIKGQVLFHCCQEKIQVSVPLSKNTDQLQSDLKNLLKNEIYADVEFHINDGVIHAHKNILCSRSTVFRKMFEQNMKEREVNRVKITDIDKSVFEVFLIFLYTGAIQDNKLDIVMPLYSVADKYAVETLLKTCSNILVSYISDATVAPILKLADMHNDADLKATAVDFICKNFVKVETTDSWDTLLSSDPRLASYALKQVSITAAKRMI